MKTKKKNKVEIPKDLKDKCSVIIHSSTAAATAACAGLAQIPLADNAVLAPIQVGMIIGIAKVFDQSIAEGAAKGLLSTFAATFVGRGVSQVLIGWIPGIGNVVNAATAGTLTETIGWMAADHFAKISTLERNEYCVENTKDEAKQEQFNNEPSGSWPLAWKSKASKIILGENSSKNDCLALINEFEEHMDSLPTDDPARRTYEKLLDCVFEL